MRWRVAVLLTGLLAAGCGQVFQPTTTAPLRLDGGQAVGQTFTVDDGPVAGVDVLLATFDEVPTPDAALTVTLREEAGGAVLATAEVPAEGLADNDWAAARFDEPVPVADGAAVTVAWDGASPLGVYANAPATGVACGPDEEQLCNDAYPGGQLLLDGEPAPGDLAFRVVGPGPGPGEVLTAGAARLDDAPVFAVTWPLALAGCAALAVWGLRRSRRAA